MGAKLYYFWLGIEAEPFHEEDEYQEGLLEEARMVELYGVDFLRRGGLS